MRSHWIAHTFSRHPSWSIPIQSFASRLSEANTLTRAGRLADATAEIQRVLAGSVDEPLVNARSRPAHGAARSSVPFGSHAPPVIEGEFREVRSPAAAPTPRPGGDEATAPRSADAGAGTFSTGMFGGAQGKRRYRLFIPARSGSDPLPMIVMLHGCTQDPEDFAAGTRMNALAQEFGFIVLYPEQDTGANGSKCWNWFQPGDQARGSGEPELLAAMTREMIRMHRVDAARVYVAGLSAGGAMAAILVDSYPEVFAAGGVHSGLAPGSARDVASAFSTMKSGPHTGATVNLAASPVIVFHGDADRTVHPRHADFVAGIAESAEAGERIASTRFPVAGRSVTHHVRRDSKGAVQAERWAVEGLGHAWSGGNASGSYTDPAGPDASREMIRFFLERTNTSRRRAAP